MDTQLELIKALLDANGIEYGAIKRDMNRIVINFNQSGVIGYGSTVKDSGGWLGVVVAVYSKLDKSSWAIVGIDHVGQQHKRIDSLKFIGN